MIGRGLAAKIAITSFQQLTAVSGSHEAFSDKIRHQVLTWNMWTSSFVVSSSKKDSCLKILMSYLPDIILRWLLPAPPAFKLQHRQQ